MPAHAQRMTSLLALDKEFALCRESREGIRCGTGQEAGGAWGIGGATKCPVHALAEGSTKRAGGQGTRGAHPEHAEHVCDARRVPAQRLVERIRSLPSRQKGTDAGRGAAREVGVGQWWHKQRAQGGA